MPRLLSCYMKVLEQWTLNSREYNLCCFLAIHCTPCTNGKLELMKDSNMYIIVIIIIIIKLLNPFIAFVSSVKEYSLCHCLATHCRPCNITSFGTICDVDFSGFFCFVISYFTHSSRVAVGIFYDRCRHAQCQLYVIVHCTHFYVQNK